MSATLARRAKPRIAPVAVVVTPEGVGAEAPAAIAFRMAITRKGRELATACGESALADALAQVRAADPARADARDVIITAAWTNRG